MTPTPSPSTRIQDIIANILNTLEVIDRANLTKSEILRLGVPFEAFDPNDEDSLDPETPWLFKPIPKEDIKPWKISASKAESVKSHLNIPNLISQGSIGLTGTSHTPRNRCSASSRHSSTFAANRRLA